MQNVIGIEDKVEHAKKIIEEGIKKYPRIAVASSFGKDSMVVIDLARKVDPKIAIFSVMTPYKPKESFAYIKEMDELLNLEVIVHYAGQEAPDELKFLEKRLKLYSDLDKRAKTYIFELNKGLKERFGADTTKEVKLYAIQPSLCCDLYKTEVTKRAVKNLDAWICGLRKDEGRTRIDYKYVEDKGDGLIKINPIIDFTEEEVLMHLKENDIPLHPWYNKEFPDGKRYRSLGCAPCTVPILPIQKERDGRWFGTSKCGGECGIHTQSLKDGAGI